LKINKYNTCLEYHDMGVKIIGVSKEPSSTDYIKHDVEYAHFPNNIMNDSYNLCEYFNIKKVERKNKLEKLKLKYL
jgi:hypothetical protein